MDDFLAQAQHNKKFLDCIETNFPDQFFDWRITVIFYIAIHLLKSLANKRGVDIGNTHYDIANSLNPKKSNKQKFPFPQWVWSKYSTIFRYSQNSRYDGISDVNIVTMAQKKNYEECVILFKDFCSYMKSNSIEL